MNDEIIFKTNLEQIRLLNELVLTTLSKHYTAAPKDCGSFSSLQIQGMSLCSNQYELKGVGNLLLLNSKDMPGLQMLTAVITPFFKALPLLSMDLMFQKEQRILILEYYDLVPSKDDFYLSCLNTFGTTLSSCQTLASLPQKPCWYDSLKTVSTMRTYPMNEDSTFSELFSKLLSGYIHMEQSLPVLSSAQQAAKWQMTQDYADGLIHQGGVSTDVFKMALGTEKTKEFFDQVFFGTKQTT